MILFTWDIVITNTVVALHRVVGIDIGKIGNIALSTGFRQVIKTEEDILNLFRQILQYDANFVSLEQHNDYSKNERKSIKGLFIANDLIVRHIKSRLNARIQIVYVDSFKTSVMCHKCKFVDRASRVQPWLFECTCCGISINADVNAALNIKSAAEEKLNDGVLEWQ